MTAVTPGQAAVFYDGDAVLGGGWIEGRARVSEPARRSRGARRSSRRRSAIASAIPRCSTSRSRIPSYAHEIDGSRGNERLEFLGDAVLDLAVARLLYDTHPRWSEGDLTRARAALVNTRMLARCARELGIGNHARLGRTERKTGGADKERILANVFEALVRRAVSRRRARAGHRARAASLRRAADSRLRPARRGSEDALPGVVARRSRRDAALQRRFGDSGVENDEARFVVEVRLAGEVWGSGTGRTKRAAERAAAEAALSRSRPRVVTSDGHRPAVARIAAASSRCSGFPTRASRRC